jgi:UDP-N-acetylglucosamine--N-acetylmuramyl-(pentapeptide) pyrophosphoryl-undecaprenol N-acetylglucosamine transferase
MKSKFIISGGGTGGHLFPAIAIANEIKNFDENAEILFIGAKGRMEMNRVPNAGYNIIGLTIAGFQRQVSFKNILKNTMFPFKLVWSLISAMIIIKRFKPDVVIGVGGYASGPTLKMASFLGVPTLIQEQNSFPGVTNRMLAKKANKICVAYEETKKYFSEHKMVITGNPIRKDILDIVSKDSEAYKYFKLDPNKKTIAVIGGSLGSKTMNISIETCLGKIRENDIQLIWQTGEKYYAQFFESDTKITNNGIKIMPFVDRMDYLYSIADLVVSRAGALSISELSCLGKPTILIPSPNVSGDHQTKNAKVLADANAAILIKDKNAIDELGKIMLETIQDDNKCAELSLNIKKFAFPNALKNIVEEIYKLKK